MSDWERRGRLTGFVVVLLLASAFTSERWGEGVVVTVLGFSAVPALLGMVAWNHASLLRLLRLACGAAAATAGALFMLTLDAAVTNGGTPDSALAIAVFIGVAGTWAADLTVARRADQDAESRHQELLDAIASSKVEVTARRPRVRDVLLLVVAFRLLRR